LDVGIDTLLTVDMLPPAGQAVIQPVLQEFASRVGPKVCAQVTVNCT
jgi:hypothetical protein